jgi:hypothetical protein
MSIEEALLEKDAHGHFTTNFAKPPINVIMLADDVYTLKCFFLQQIRPLYDQ